VRERNPSQQVIDYVQDLVAEPAQIGCLDPPGDAVDHARNLNDRQDQQEPDRHDDDAHCRQQGAAGRQAGAKTPVEPIEKWREQIRPDGGHHDEHEIVAQEICTEQQSDQRQDREGAFLSEREFGFHTDRAALRVVAVELNLNRRRCFSSASAQVHSAARFLLA